MNPATSTATEDDADGDTPKKRNVPKRKFPDFSKAYSKENPFLSGDESDQWEAEEENIAVQAAMGNALEELAALELSGPVEEVTELDYLWKNVEGEEGDVDGQATAVPVCAIYESILVNKKTTNAELKEICKALGLNSSGNKPVLFARIRDSGNELIEQMDDELFTYKRKKGEVDASLPRWVILNPDPAPSVPGIDMLRGAQEGFFGPTNQENAVGASKSQYCCREEEKIRRPEFASKTPDLAVSEKGGISPAARKLLPEEIRDCRPKNFFDTQISPEFVKRCMVDTTNACAAAEGAGFGGTQYNDWEPFNLAEMNKMMGLLFVNGLSPRPRIKM